MPIEASMACRFLSASSRICARVAARSRSISPATASPPAAERSSSSVSARGPTWDTSKCGFGLSGIMHNPEQQKLYSKIWWNENFCVVLLPQITKKDLELIASQQLSYSTKSTRNTLQSPVGAHRRRS